MCLWFPETSCTWCTRNAQALWCLCRPLVMQHCHPACSAAAAVSFLSTTTWTRSQRSSALTPSQSSLVQSRLLSDWSVVAHVAVVARLKKDLSIVLISELSTSLCCQHSFVRVICFFCQIISCQHAPQLFFHRIPLHFSVTLAWHNCDYFQGIRQM